MSDESPAVVLYSKTAKPHAVDDGVAIPASTPALLVAGTDGGTARYIVVDALGQIIVVGKGVAGTPAGGVLTIQGDPAGTPIPISGSITAVNDSVGTPGAAVPPKATQIGGSDGTNLETARIFDLDTGGGTEYDLGVSVRLPGAGGSVAGGTASNPFRTDPTGATTQPISAAALPLPAGAATEATLATLLTTVAFQARINTLGQKAMAASTPVVLASDQTVIPVSDNAGSLTVDTPQLPAALVGGRLDTNLGAWLSSTAPTVGQKAMVSSIPVVLASDQTAIAITGTITATEASIGLTGAAVPASATQIGGSDGTNLQAPLVFDADSGAGTQYVLGAILRKSDSGGSVEAGTATDPLRIDPTGTTTQPISAVSLPLPAGAATEVTLAALVADATITARLNTLGQKTMADSAPVVIASDQSDVPVKIDSWFGSAVPTVGQKAMAASIPVTLAFDQSAFPILLTPTDNVGGGFLNALNASVTTDTVGPVGIGIFAGTLGGTLVAEISLDGGTTWVQTVFVDSIGNTFPSLSGTFNTDAAYSIALVGGTSTARVRVASFVRGSTLVYIRSKQGLPDTDRLPANTRVADVTAALSTTNTILGTLATEGGQQFLRDYTLDKDRSLHEQFRTGQKTSAKSLPVVVASDQSVPVSVGLLVKSNSTTTPLLANAYFTGEWASCVGFDSIHMHVLAGFPSATNAVGIAWANDASGTEFASGTNESYEYTEAPGYWQTFIFTVKAPFFRITFGNGAANQLAGLFAISTELRLTSPGTLGDPLIVSAPGTVTALTGIGGVLDPTNSSSFVLAANATFTGSFTSCIGYDQIQVYVSSDQGSDFLPDGLKVTWDYDGFGTNAIVDLEQSFQYIPDGWALFVIRIRAPYFRISYKNGATLQTVFGLATVLKVAAPDSTVLEGQALLSTIGWEQDRGTLIAGSAPGAYAKFISVSSTGAVEVTPDGGNAWPISAVSLPLPTGAATEATLATLLTTAAFQARINTLGQKAMAASTPVVLASDQSNLIVNQGTAAAVGQAWPAKISDGAIVAALKAASTAAVATDQALVVAISPNNTIPISAVSLPLPAGAATDAVLTGGTAKSIVRGGAKGATVAADVTSTAEGADHQALDVQLYSGAAAINPQTIRALTAADVVSAELTKWIGSTAPTVGSKTSANSIPVVIASDQAAVTVSGPLTDTQLRASAVPISASALPLPSGAATSSNQTTLGSQTTKINDGTNTVTVKPSSTAPLATDTSLVVTVSPNTQTVPVNIAIDSIGLATSAKQSNRTQNTQITDGTRDGTIKAGGVAPVAGDTALVVTLSPNSSTGGNTTASSTIATATNTVGVSLAGAGIVGVQITGAWVGQLVFRATIDGTNYFPILAVPADSTGNLVGIGSTSTNGQWLISAAGYNSVQVYANRIDSGIATVTLVASANVIAPDQALVPVTTSVALPVYQTGNSYGSDYAVLQFHVLEALLCEARTTNLLLLKLVLSAGLTVTQYELDSASSGGAGGIN